MTGNHPEVGSLAWRVSTRSSSGGGNCVEVGATRWHTGIPSTGSNWGEVGNGPGSIAVRDSKDRDGGMLVVGTAPWTAFLDVVRAGRLG
ncbi:toxin [Actinocatenispora thailandica]|uniref:Toxin n=1 Tax=Actinocatenispora thailandica TaxID=227318 RepID=A0A7R7HWL7_9ACTN|nr:DUF397 domain-containing protein [Actinocatenispora thailandica]BCJ35013.1 toxin [Actinocatenispora thailandica]